MRRWEDRKWQHSMRVKIDLNNVFVGRVGNHRGLDVSEIDSLNQRVSKIHSKLSEERKNKRLGFYDLPYQKSVVEEINELSKKIQDQFQNLVVLGIGGSALGAIAIKNALEEPFHSSGSTKVFILDNVDPYYFGSFLESLKIEETCFVVISKSGTTAETMSQFMIVHEMLKNSGGKSAISKQLIAITDPKKGCLREIAIREKYTILSIPPSVGGRFSVLSPVGLLPAAVMGIDIEEMMAGARYMDKRCSSDQLWNNPAYTLGSVYYLADRKKGQNMFVFMPYSNELHGVADWLRQLIAESLGKKYSLDEQMIFVGPTPIKALGTTDQHSQLQLYMEGPFNKIITFFRVDSFGKEVRIPNEFPEIDALSYLGEKSLNELINAEQMATAIALAKNGRTNLTINVPEINPFVIGELFFLFEVITVYMGALYNINPLDQPGVEESKKNTYAIMGRKGYEERAEEIKSDLASDSRFIV